MLFSTKYEIGDIIYAVDFKIAIDSGPYCYKKEYFLVLDGKPLTVTEVLIHYSQRYIGIDGEINYSYYVTYKAYPYHDQFIPVQYMFSELDAAKDFVEQKNIEESKIYTLH